MLCSAAGCEFDVCVCIIAPPLKTRDLPLPSSSSSPLVTCALQISGMIISADRQRSNDGSNPRLIARGRATQSNQDALLVRDFFSNL